MAKYNITDLNYIAVGANKCFINMDTQLGYQIYDYIHLLCAENQTSGYETTDDKRNGNLSVLSVDIGTEQGEGYCQYTDYIQKADDEVLSKEKYYEQIVLNEKQPTFVETDPTSKKYIRLYLSCCTIEMKNKIDEFNRTREHINCTYIADIRNSKNDKNNLTVVNEDSSNVYQAKCKNLYDIVDVTLQTIHVHETKNLFLHDTDHRHEMYLPQLTKQPVGFCQTQTDNEYFNDAIMLTHGMNSEVQMLKTSFAEDRRKFEDTLYNTSIQHGRMRAYTYRTYDEWSETNFNQDKFIPRRDYVGIAKPYIVDMPVESTRFESKCTDVNDYSTGEMYFSRLHVGKSMYDALYSVNMTSLSQMSCARQYCGIETCAGRPYLKFYDNINYNAQTDVTDNKDITEILTLSANSSGNSKYDHMTVPYQKIEYLYPADYNYSELHKANAYNVTILNTGIDKVESQIEEAEDKLAKLDTNSQQRYEDQSKLDEAKSKLATLKFEITNAVRQIAKHIAPANTQLVDVKFGD